MDRIGEFGLQNTPSICVHVLQPRHTAVSECKRPRQQFEWHRAIPFSSAPPGSGPRSMPTLATLPLAAKQCIPKTESNHHRSRQNRSTIQHSTLTHAHITWKAFLSATAASCAAAPESPAQANRTIACTNSTCAHKPRPKQKSKEPSSQSTYNISTNLTAGITVFEACIEARNCSARRQSCGEPVSKRENAALVTWSQAVG